MIKVEQYLIAILECIVTNEKGTPVKKVGICKKKKMKWNEGCFNILVIAGRLRSTKLNFHKENKFTDIFWMKKHDELIKKTFNRSKSKKCQWSKLLKIIY